MTRRSFRDRDPLRLGVAGLAVLSALLVLTFNIGRIPFLRPSTDYHVYLSDAGGLDPGRPVIVSGLTVGAVDGMRIDRGAVLVDFHVSQNTVLPDRTRASVSVRTLLGEKALKLEPSGAGRMPDDSTIPLDRTTAPYDVTTALSDLTRTTQQVDTGQLAKAMDTASEDFQETPADLRGTLNGLNRLSEAVASRDNDLAALLRHANSVTGVLAERNAQVVTLLSDGQALLAEFNARRSTIHALLANTDRVANQLTGLVQDNATSTNPTLHELRDTLDLLDRNRQNLASSLRNAVPFARSLGEAVASGPFFQVYIQNLLPYDLKPTLPAAQRTGPRR
jgi:phospholipid/cholesterol/gamma-HCH transport system substrate-binding protein